MAWSQAEDRAPALDEDRRREEAFDRLASRFRYERLIVVPVSLGMLAAFFGNSVLSLIENFRATSISPVRHGDAQIAIFSAGAALAGLAAEVLRRRGMR